MALNTGVFNNTLNPTQLNQRSFNESILRLFPNGTAPLFGLSSQTGKKKAKAVEHGYFTKQFTFNELAMTAAATAVATNLTIAATAGVVIGQLFMVKSSREMVRVTAIVNATTVTVTRGYGRIAAAAILITDVLAGAGTAYAEGANRPTARNITAAYVSNFTQIFRNAWAVTGTAKATLVEAGFGNVQENRKDMMLFHATDIETATFFGQASLTVLPNTQPEHTTQGIIDAIAQHAPANMQLAGATTNLTQLEAMFEKAFQFSTDLGNAKERVAFVDAQTLRVLNQVARLNGVVELMPDQTTFGMSFNRFRFFKGEIQLIEHPMFNGMASMAGSLVMVDLPALKYAYLEGRDAMVENYGADGNQAIGGADAVGGSLTSELAVEMVNPAACTYITGFTAGAAG